jgi:secreted trypsin-like serine protease
MSFCHFRRRLGHLNVDSENDGKIVGGHDATNGEVPFQVAMMQTNSGFQFCAGSILNNNTILTAAHCCSGQSVAGVTIGYGGLDKDELEVII